MLHGIDNGTSAVTAALVDGEAGVVDTSQHGVELHSAGPGWAEADPEQWWRGVCATVGELCARAAGAEIDAVACSGMVPALVALDASGVPLRRAILQNDARATEELDDLHTSLHDVDFVSLTG
jgi:xylulokinase